MKTYVQHDLAKLIPAQSKEDREAQEESILKSGLVDEITLFEGRVMDGWHRYNLCLKHNITPRFKEFHSFGVTPKDFLIAKIAGRHLTPTQKACVALEFQREMAEKFKVALRTKRNKQAVPKQTEEGGNSRNIISKTFGVGVSTLAYALTVWNRDRKLFDKCFKGEMTIFAALKAVRSPDHPSVKPNKFVMPEVIVERSEGLPLPTCHDSYEKGMEFVRVMCSAPRNWQFQSFCTDGKWLVQFYGNGVAMKTQWKELDRNPRWTHAVAIAAMEAMKK